MPQKEKKSFKKYATKHLADEIVRRRTTQKARKEKAERLQRRDRREKREAAAEEKQHKAELDALKEQDPGFYSFLEEEDPTLLQFGNENIDVVDEDEGSDAETDVDEAEGAADGEGEESEGPARVTLEELQSAVKDKKESVLINLFVSAAREIGAKIKDSSAGSDARRKFTDPSLVKQTLVLTSKALGNCLTSLIKQEKGSPSFANAKSRTVVKRFLLGCIAVVVDCASDVVLAAKMLQSLNPFIPMLHLIRGCTKAILKVVLNCASSPDETLRVASYMIVRKIATRVAGSRTMYQSTAFKGMFLALIRTAHTYNIHNMPVVGFLMNALVDLYGTDMEAAYQHAFVYLRQLAIYLRAALQQQTQTNVRTVFNWQFINALRTWGLVVSTYAAPEQLGPLIHPVVQLALGVMDLFSSPRCFPMHLHVLEMLNHISTRAGVYIPVATYILRIITSPSLKLDKSNAKQDEAINKLKKRKQREGDDEEGGDAGGEAITDLQFAMRVKKSQQRSQTYIVNVWTECLYLLTEHLASHSHSIGFPEAFWVVSATLNKLRKDVRMPKLHNQITILLQHMQTVSKAITAKRDQVSFGPCDATAVKMFEDDLRSAQGNSPAKALTRYYDSLRAQRVAEFNAKQGASSGKAKRTTLESVAEESRVAGRKQRRDDDEDEPVADTHQSSGKGKKKRAE